MQPFINNSVAGHTFHIPVMGLAYTIDTPVKVARFGISSVISIVEDRLIEMMRKHYYEKSNREFMAISRHEDDYRAKRITDYLNLINEMVQEQIQKLKNEAFKAGSEIVKYFEMLPDTSPVKKIYNEMVSCKQDDLRLAMQEDLRNKIVAGSIDVNIMTKTDRDNRDKLGNVIPNGSDAVAALRGYIKSDLSDSSIVFSAGLNPRVYAYLENQPQFLPDQNGVFPKKVIIKVSDYRSALIQGKFLAKKGVWVSEFRIESGLNCGGHAFPTGGHLMGPILEEFKLKRQELMQSIFDIYSSYLQEKVGITLTQIPELRVSVQGGIGTAEEDHFLRNYYQVDSTGWGTPFLLVPEATTVDAETLILLKKAKAEDLILSHNSPLGVRFHYLKNTTADIEKAKRIQAGRPGSPCTEKHLGFNTEFTVEPICTASAKYQKLKLKELETLALSTAETESRREGILAKECLCVGLSNSAALVYNETFLGPKFQAVNICPGPNIINFSEELSLKDMVSHIYGKKELMTNPQRPHMFITELNLYIKYLKDELSKAKIDEGINNFYKSYSRNLLEAIHYYRALPEYFARKRKEFNEALLQAETYLQELQSQFQLVEA